MLLLLGIVAAGGGVGCTLDTYMVLVVVVVVDYTSWDTLAVELAYKVASLRDVGA